MKLCRCLRFIAFCSVFLITQSWVARASDSTPFNDLWQNAFPLQCNETLSDSTYNAKIYGDVPDCDFLPITAPGVWYSIIGTGEDITITTCSTNTKYDTILSVYTEGLTCVVANDDDWGCSNDGFQSTVSFPSELGQEYLILVHGAGESGDFELSIESADTDGDCVGDNSDNCPNDQNPDQADADSDGVGEVCDNCPDTPNPDQLDSNQDGVGDACEDPDPDGGGVFEVKQGAVDALSDLLPTGDEKTNHRIEKAIEHIEKSLKDNYWETDSTLTKKGQKVFDEKKKAVKELEKLIKKDDLPQPIKDVCQEAIDKLIQAVQLLANAAYEEAQSYAGNPKVDKELEKCQKEMDKTKKKLGHTKKDGAPDPKYDKAIDHYKKVWEHAQHAMK